MPKSELLIQTLIPRQRALSVAHGYISINIVSMVPWFVSDHEHVVAVRSLLELLETRFKVSRNTAHLSGHRICTADDFALYGPSSCFLLFTTDVLEDTKVEIAVSQNMKGE